jgi:PEGA domain
MRISSALTLAALALAAAVTPALAQSPTGYLKTKVEPGRAGVFVDGKYVGPAANFGVGRKYALAPGDHEIRLSEPRYEEVVSKVTIEPGKTVKLSQTMKALPLAKPPFGTLRTMAPDKFSAVYVNGRFMGHAGEFNNPYQGLNLNPGDYKVKIVPVGATDGREEQVKIEADKTSIVRFQK